MGSRYHRRGARGAILIAALFVAMALPARAATGQGRATAVASQRLRIGFGDFTSTAELRYPAGAAKSPTVILIPGSSPEDMDADIAGSPGGPVLSHIFLDIARYLAPRGFAVLRYNKHYVTSRAQVDYRRFYGTLTLQRMLRDAEAVLAAARADPHVDGRHIFLYGWSEGSTVAAALAARHPEVAGLIVQGPVALPWRQTFRYQITAVGLPYLRRFAPDGRVTAAVLRRAARGTGGLVARGVVAYFAAAGARPGTYALYPYLDPNHDGAVDIDREFLPALGRELDFLLSPAGPFAIYAPGRALPTVAQQTARLRRPMLILQGANDANVPPAGARALDAALGAVRASDHTLLVFPGLGHTLGPSVSPIDDNFRPIAAAPLAALAQWLARHAPPATSGG